MATINVLRKVRIDSKWKLLPVAKIEDRLDWTHVVHHGVPMVSTEGTFYLEWRQAKKRMRRAVGNHPREAKDALSTQQSVVNLRDQGIEVVDAPVIMARRPMTGTTIEEAITAFKKTSSLSYRETSEAKYKNALSGFLSWTDKTHLSQLDRSDVTNFMGYLVSVEKLDHSTAVDKGHIIHTVFNRHGAEIKMKRGDWPRVTETEIEIYEPEVLQQLFASMEEDDFVLFQTFLMTGFRDREIGFLSWPDFKPHTNALRVSQKIGMGFKPKNYQERTIPIPDELVKILVQYKKKQDPLGFLMFPTSAFLAHQGRPGGQRDRHMLDRLKKIAMKSGLNCGHCTGTWKKKEVTCATQPICGKFGLHKFRHTYATTLLHDGVDLISLQTLLGHKDLESTRKYLKALKPANLLTKIRGTSLATKFLSQD